MFGRLSGRQFGRLFGRLIGRRGGRLPGRGVRRRVVLLLFPRGGMRSLDARGGLADGLRHPRRIVSGLRDVVEGGVGAVGGFGHKGLLPPGRERLERFEGPGDVRLLCPVEQGREREPVVGADLDEACGGVEPVGEDCLVFHAHSLRRSVARVKQDSCERNSIAHKRCRCMSDCAQTWYMRAMSAACVGRRLPFGREWEALGGMGREASGFGDEPLGDVEVVVVQVEDEHGVGLSPHSV